MELDGRPAIMDVVSDMTDPTGNSWLLTRINVPEVHRGKGHGKALLLKLLELADAHKQTISLGVSSSNPKFTNGKLRAWYKRNGFVKPTGAPTNSLTRKPQ